MTKIDAQTSNNSSVKCPGQRRAAGGARNLLLGQDYQGSISFHSRQTETMMVVSWLVVILQK
jgi:hypothetical protein